MTGSATFTALDTMVRQGWFWKRFSKFERLLDLLEEKNLITSAEHQALLELAKQFSIDNLDDSQHSI